MKLKKLEKAVNTEFLTISNQGPQDMKRRKFTEIGPYGGYNEKYLFQDLITAELQS